MNEKTFTQAQDEYMEFWQKESEQTQVAARMAYRAGVVWLVKQLMNKPFDELAKAIVSIHRELTITGQ